MFVSAVMVGTRVLAPGVALRSIRDFSLQRERADPPAVSGLPCTEKLLLLILLRVRVVRLAQCGWPSTFSPALFITPTKTNALSLPLSLAGCSIIGVYTVVCRSGLRAGSRPSLQPSSRCRLVSHRNPLVMNIDTCSPWGPRFLAFNIRPLDALHWDYIFRLIHYLFGRQASLKGCFARTSHLLRPLPRKRRPTFELRPGLTAFQAL